jgi:hypothetical protein
MLHFHLLRGLRCALALRLRRFELALDDLDLVLQMLFKVRALPLLRVAYVAPRLGYRRAMEMARSRCGPRMLLAGPAS